jgi:hypothetical protein
MPASSTGSEQRGAARFALLLRVAKLVVDGREYLCILRDASATGARIRLFHSLPAGTDLAIELGNGDQYPADVVWYRDDHAGLRFKREIDVRRLLDDNRSQYPKRQIRLKLHCPVLLTANGRSFEGQVRNISQQGACIECSGDLRVREPVRIECKGLPIIHGKVCWRDSPQCGVVFEQGFGIEELAQLMVRLHHTHASESPPSPSTEFVPFDRP